jgi:hypothetical protein
MAEFVTKTYRECSCCGFAQHWYIRKEYKAQQMLLHIIYFKQSQTEIKKKTITKIDIKAHYSSAMEKKGKNVIYIYI